MMPIPVNKITAFSASLAAPIGGWNARDALGEMEETDAVTLTNMVPLTSDVMVRKGYTNYVTGIPGQVESLMQYSSPTAQKLFCAAMTSFYDVTNAGTVGAAVVTSLSNARWQYINVSTSGGSFLLSVNGTDKLRGFDGSTWYTDGDGSHDISGVDTATCIGINLFKTRVWLVQKNTLKIWYLGVNSISGSAAAFDFQSIAKRGGYLMAMGTWTIDAGYGVDDLAVFVTSEGEVIVYKGTDPTSASTWALVGVWYMGAPIGRRCLFKFGGDLLVISQDGVQPLSGALQSSRVNPRVSLTDKIQFAMSSAATNYGSNFGWQLLLYAKANMLILNVPVSQGSAQQQYVMNTITKAWCNFTGWGANCWEIFEDEPYFGGSGFVGKAWNNFSDNNVAFPASGKQAFNYFGSRGELKRWTMIRPVLFLTGPTTIGIGLNVDFDDYDITANILLTPSSSALWDSAMWDVGSWGGDFDVTREWQGATGIGYCAAPRFNTLNGGIDIRWVSTDLVMEKGGIL